MDLPDYTVTYAELRKAAEECGDVPPVDPALAKAWKTA